VWTVMRQTGAGPEIREIESGFCARTCSPTWFGLLGRSVACHRVLPTLGARQRVAGQYQEPIDLRGARKRGPDELDRIPSPVD